MPAGNKIVVIGAGVVGTVTALSLRKEGFDVTLVDEKAPGSQCSFGNAGVLGAGTCVPLSMPGNLRDVPAWLFNNTSPLSISLPYFPLLLPWLLRFLRAGKLARVKKISKALADINSPTVSLYSGLVKEAGIENVIQRSGYLHLYESESSFRRSELGWKLREENGVDFQVYAGAEINELEPALSSYAKGVLIPNDAYLSNPRDLVSGLFRRFMEIGGHFINAKVFKINVEDDGKYSLITDHGIIGLDKAIIACGALSNELLRGLGTSVPLEAERGYHVTIKNPGISPRFTIMSSDYKYVTTPMECGLRLAGKAEFSGLRRPPDFESARSLIPLGKRMFPELVAEDFSEWSGFRPTTPDSLPVIGALPKHPNIVCAFGHGHTGMAGAPMTAKLITEIVQNRPASLDMDMYRVNRFL
ncbi:MAG: FAD-dependent oxidoreductase [Ketobacteraceae bacterium]|nr:FAD-dependent oxidoreductase [Ketobacteraceae bacterium]